MNTYKKMGGGEVLLLPSGHPGAKSEKRRAGHAEAIRHCQQPRKNLANVRK